MKSELELLSLFFGGMISGIGITLAFLVSQYFFILVALGLLPYVVLLERSRAKKNPPND
ncbi:hypothetical protein QN372_19745 [Undibacterium sp. RTI2.1]|uniref:hypothetical protein n=1 Tax=unclassified Undibacterium TaxID=2630295 RepID=UPI002B22C818|nr:MULTISPECIES: hypothetical protein [unclassified Undibacterium]MEB0032986.1 hypothetical protein [Undibacterium sp. RTI2.1]MEB0118841.1 hypothetical protein [Undibacterium sp. RTI2.2]